MARNTFLELCIYLFGLESSGKINLAKIRNLDNLQIFRLTMYFFIFCSNKNQKPIQFADFSLTRYFIFWA